MAHLLLPHHPPPAHQKDLLDRRQLRPLPHHWLAANLKFVQLKMCSITRHQQTTKKETWCVSGQSGSSAEDGLMGCGVTSPLTPLPSSLESGVMRGLRMVIVYTYHLLQVNLLLQALRRPRRCPWHKMWVYWFHVGRWYQHTMCVNIFEKGYRIIFSSHFTSSFLCNWYLLQPISSPSKSPSTSPTQAPTGSPSKEVSMVAVVSLLNEVVKLSIPKNITHKLYLSF